MRKNKNKIRDSEGNKQVLVKQLNLTFQSAVLKIMI